MARHFEGNPRLWSEDRPFGMQSSLLSRRNLTERISAACIMGRVGFGRASLLGGVRVGVLVQYRRSRVIRNWKSKYNFSRKLSVFLDVDNVTSTPSIVGYIGFKERQNNWYTFDPRIQVGIGGQF